MKKTTTLLTVTLFAAITITSCKKSDAPSLNNSNADLTKVQEFFDKHKPKYESFTLNAAAGGTITLASGTKITFPANNFKDDLGNIITGNVDISAKDILKASSMILDDKPTITSDGKMLESFGELIVNAKQGNKPLQIIKPAPAVIPIGIMNGNREFPIWSGDSMVNYTANGHNHENQPTSITTTIGIKRGIDWTKLSSFGVANTTSSSFALDALGEWRNCDAIYSTPGTKITVLGYFGSMFNDLTIGTYMGKEPSMLFFKAQGVNSLIKLYNVILNAAPGKEGFLSYQNCFSVGQQGTFLAISTKNGKFYAEMKDVTVAAPEAGKNYTGINFNLTEVSETQLLSLINQMNTK